VLHFFFERESNIAQIRRVQLDHDGIVAVELILKDGRSDLLIAADAAKPAGILSFPAWNAQLDGELCWARRDKNHDVRHVALCRGNSIRIGSFAVNREGKTDFVQWP
jgi:hypothetical protein